jgi:hypothetical protein
MGVADQTVAALHAAGHDVVHAREIGVLIVVEDAEFRIRRLPLY